MDRSQLPARLAGLFFLCAVGLGVFAEFRAHGQVRLAARIAALCCYLVVTVLLYQTFKPVNRSLSITAAVLALLLVVVAPFGWHPGGVDVGLVCFGASWLVTAYLVFISGMFAKAVGVLSAMAGVAWLTFLSRSLSQSLQPYNLAVGIIGQVAFCLWLLAFGARQTDSHRPREP